MAEYKTDLSNPIPMLLLVPTWTNVSGVSKKTYPKIEDMKETDFEDKLFFGSFKTYGGTERDVNGVYSIEDTANVETWFRPDIKSDCRVALINSGAIYEIVNEPENINQRNQFLKFKLKRVKGGA